MVNKFLKYTLPTLALSALVSFSPLFNSNSSDTNVIAKTKTLKATATKTTTTNTSKDIGTTTITNGDGDSLVFKDGSTVSAKEYGTSN